MDRRLRYALAGSAVALAALLAIHDWTPRREFRFVSGGEAYVYRCRDEETDEAVRHRAEAAHRTVIDARAILDAEVRRVGIATFADPEAELAPATERFAQDLAQVERDQGCTVDLED